MTNWLPDVSTGSGPLYMRLADSIETDITKGILPAGAKLPPQRDLAYDIGVTIGTIGRAYALVRERGLVSGEVGGESLEIEGALPFRGGEAACFAAGWLFLVVALVSPLDALGAAPEAAMKQLTVAARARDVNMQASTIQDGSTVTRPP